MVNDPILNDWHVVAPVQNLQPGTILQTRLLGEDLVLWRDRLRSYAWQDLCPHRGARLSLGWVAGDTLVCPYHGLAYNSEGRCVKIPAHPDLSPPAKVQVQTYQILERYDLIWVTLGNPNQNLPPFPEWDEASYRRFLCGPYHYQSSGLRAIENFLDVAHLPFVHGGILGDSSRTAIDDYEVEIEANGITLHVRVWQPDPDGTGKSGLVTYNYRVFRPLTAYFYKESEGRRFSIFFTVTPVEEEKCIGWMWVAMNYAHEVPEDQLRTFQNRIVMQDIPIVESQRPRQLPLDLQAEFHLPSDRASIAYRKWLRELGVCWGVNF